MAEVLKELLLVGWWMYSMGLQSSLHLEEDHWVKRDQRPLIVPVAVSAG